MRHLKAHLPAAGGSSFWCRDPAISLRCTTLFTRTSRPALHRHRLDWALDEVTGFVATRLFLHRCHRRRGALHEVPLRVSARFRIGSDGERGDEGEREYRGEETVHESTS